MKNISTQKKDFHNVIIVGRILEFEFPKHMYKHRRTGSELMLDPQYTIFLAAVDMTNVEHIFSQPHLIA